MGSLVFYSLWALAWSFLPTLGLLFFVSKFTRRKSIRYVALFAFPTLFLWDEWAGFVYFQSLCNLDAGVKVYRSVENVRRVNLPYMHLDCKYTCQLWLRGHGYDVVESWSRKPGHGGPFHFLRFERIHNRQADCRGENLLFFQKDKTFEEDTCVRRTIKEWKDFRSDYMLLSNEPVELLFRNSLGVYGTRQSVRETKSGEVLAERVEYNFRGGWFGYATLPHAVARREKCIGRAVSQDLLFPGNNIEDAVITKILVPRSRSQ